MCNARYEFTSSVFHAGNKLWTAGIYLVAQNKKTQKLQTNKICHADGRHNTAYFFLI